MKYPLLALALLTLAACDATRTDEGVPETGTYTYQTQGAYAEARDGRALFAPSLNDGLQAFTVQLQTAADAPNVLVALDWAGAARPAAGTYTPVATFAEAAAGKVAVSYTRSSSNPFSYESFRPGSGTVTITTSTARAIGGTLDLTLTDAGRTLRLTGSFTATPGH